MDGLHQSLATESAGTVFESSLPVSMIRRHRGMISVVNRKLITSCSSVFTSAPTGWTHAQTYQLYSISEEFPFKQIQ